MYLQPTFRDYKLMKKAKKWFNSLTVEKQFELQHEYNNHSFDYIRWSSDLGWLYLANIK